MAKKIWYSTPLKFIWENLYRVQKNLTPEIPDEGIFFLLKRNLVRKAQVDPINLESNQLLISGLDLWKEDLTGKFLHIFFLEKRLQDFLENTPLPELDGIRKYLYENGQQKDVVFIRTSVKQNVLTIHLACIFLMKPMGTLFLLVFMRTTQ